MNSSDVRELGRVHSVEQLAAGLRETERVVYSANGNRAASADALLVRLEDLAPRLGIERLADISFLSPSDYPVFQSCRPNLYAHDSTGQNTGSQGKGPTRTQAKISCLMEAVEGYCMEPKHLALVRGSYDFLKHQHVICDPKELPFGKRFKVTHAEPFVWTDAYCVELDTKILVPAEAVYFPLCPRDFQTRSVFTYGSNGIAAGSTYLEAAIHALYEIIERHYTALFYSGDVECEAIDEGLVGIRAIQKFRDTAKGEYELQLYNLRIPGVDNVPMILCLLLGDDRFYTGWGCSFTLDISLDRAVSEALQSMATFVSGAREDFQHRKRPKGEKLFEKTAQPAVRTLTLDMLPERGVLDETFTTLKQEFDAILGWMHSLGMKHTFIANLTRVGVDIPVVRAIVPGFKPPERFAQPFTWHWPLVVKRQFHLGSR